MTEHSFNKMYKQYYTTVKNTVIATLFSKDAGDIQGCINDVFLAAYTDTTDLSSHPNLGGWLFLTARNYAHRYNKQRYKENVRSVGEVTEDYTDFAASDFVTTLAEDIDYREKIESGAVEKILAGFNKGERDFYDLKYGRKLSDAEVSQVSGMSINSVRVRTHRLKNKVHKILAKMYGGNV